MSLGRSSGNRVERDVSVDKSYFAMIPRKFRTKQDKDIKSKDSAWGMIGNKLRSSTAGELWEIESSLKWWQGLESDWQTECEAINQEDQKAEGIKGR